MYFRTQGLSHLLRLDEGFARLTNVAENGDMSFEFTYSISQEKAIQRKATSVVVSVESRSVIKKPVMGDTQRGRIDARAIIDNLRTAVVDAKTSSEQQSRYLVARRISDVSAAINNDVVSMLSAKVPAAMIPAMTRPRLVLTSVSDVKRKNDHQPLLHMIINGDVQHELSSSLNANPQALMHDMIVRQGLDPTYALSLTSRSSSEATTQGGLSTSQLAKENVGDPATRLLNYYLFPPTSISPPTTSDAIADTEMIYVMQPVVVDEIEIAVNIVLPDRRRRIQGTPADQLYVTFQLLDNNTGLPVDSVTRVLDVPHHVRIYNTPKVAPRVGFSSLGTSGRINLEIKQVDPGALGVHVYKKAFWTSSTDIDTYSLVGSYPLTSHDQSQLVQVDVPMTCPALYRVIPFGAQSTPGFEFTNVAVKPSRYSPAKAVSLVTMQLDTGIQLEIRHVPIGVIAVHFLRWNLTTHDRSPTTVGSDVGFIDESVRLVGMLSAIDTTVKPDNVYRYQARLIYRDGCVADSGDVVVGFIRPSPGQVDTRVENLTVNHDEFPNVTFEINTTTVDSDIDVVKKMLHDQGMSQFFSDDILKQRDQLKNLIAHNVQRLDLSTGRREDFGIITESMFNDDVLRKKQSVDRLKYGHRYRYEVYPMLRAPETLFDSYVKQVIDPVTKKSYSFSPAKSLHPFTLKRGVIVSSTGARVRYAKDPMTYGVVGSISYFEVSFDIDPARIVDPSVSMFDKKTALITWSIMGDMSKIDHFVIMKQVHGIRTVAGKAHSQFSHGSCQYVQKLTEHDSGAIQYVIVPVFCDYKIGQEGITNTMVVQVL